MPEKYVNEMKKSRMEGPSSSVEAVSSNDGAKVSPADFKSADSFLKAETDNSIKDLGKGSIGEKSVPKPVLKKGEKGPKGPGVI